MIIRIRIKNFLSFHDEIELNMVPGQGRLKSEHKSAPVGGYSTLKTTAVCGANAGGKSNLVKAVAFIKYMVLHGTRPDGLIDYHKFLLSKESKRKILKLKLIFRQIRKTTITELSLTTRRLWVNGSMSLRNDLRIRYSIAILINSRWMDY